MAIISVFIAFLIRLSMYHVVLYVTPIWFYSCTAETPHLSFETKFIAKNHFIRGACIQMHNRSGCYTYLLSTVGTLASSVCHCICMCISTFCTYKAFCPQLLKQIFSTFFLRTKSFKKFW